MLNVRHTLLASALLATSIAGSAAPQADAAPESVSASVVSPDSCAAAFATIMAQYLRPELAKRSDNPSVDEFIRGVREAFAIRDSSDAYHFGVRNGLGMLDRVDGMAEMGFPITPANFCAALAQAMQGTAMGFDANSADEYLRVAMNRINPPKEEIVLTPESQQQFLSEQAKREGVQMTPSGLLYEVITEGEGPHPTDTDMVKVTYTGKLSDGTIFDQTERPVQFPVKNLVPGFTEGLKLMKPGGQYRLFIPAQLGYGDLGAGGVIPPGAVLDFTVTLLEITPGQQPQN